MAAYSRDEYLLGEDLDFLTDFEEDLTFEPGVWEVGDQYKVCKCEIPSTENLIRCSEQECTVKWFHRECVGLGHNGVAVLAAGPECGAGGLGGADEHPLQAVQPSTASAMSVSTEELWTCKDCSCSRSVRLRSQEASSSTGKTKFGPATARPKRRKPNRKKAKSTMDRQAITDRGPQLIHNALNEVQLDKLYADGSVSRLAQSIKCEEDSFINLAKELVDNIYTCATAGDGFTIGPSANIEVSKSFHVFRCRPEVKKKWTDFLRQQNVEESDRVKFTLFQYILRKTLSFVLTLMQGEQSSESVDDTHRVLSKEEEGVLRLVAGYIPFALVKRYRRMKAPLGKKLTAVLLKWKLTDDNKTEADSFLEYTSVWMTHQNRGGLFQVRDAVYRFVWTMENVVRKELSVSKLVGRDVSAKEVLERAVNCNNNVQKCWNVLVCEDLEEQEAEDLFSTVVKYYIAIRLRNYVKLYVNMKKKQKMTESRKGGKGLRKELKKKSTSI